MQQPRRWLINTTTTTRKTALNPRTLPVHDTTETRSCLHACHALSSRFWLRTTKNISVCSKLEPTAAGTTRRISPLQCDCSLDSHSTMTRVQLVAETQWTWKRGCPDTENIPRENCTRLMNAVVHGVPSITITNVRRRRWPVNRWTFADHWPVSRGVNCVKIGALNGFVHRYKYTWLVLCFCFRDDILKLGTVSPIQTIAPFVVAEIAYMRPYWPVVQLRNWLGPRLWTDCASPLGYTDEMIIFCVNLISRVSLGRMQHLPSSRWRSVNSSSDISAHQQNKRITSPFKLQKRLFKILRLARIRYSICTSATAKSHAIQRGPKK